jgi:hypothetical protein
MLRFFFIVRQQQKRGGAGGLFFYNSKAVGEGGLSMVGCKSSNLQIAVEPVFRADTRLATKSASMAAGPPAPLPPSPRFFLFFLIFSIVCVVQVNPDK